MGGEDDNNVFTTRHKTLSKYISKHQHILTSVDASGLAYNAFSPVKHPLYITLNDTPQWLTGHFMMSFVHEWSSIRLLLVET